MNPSARAGAAVPTRSSTATPTRVAFVALNDRLGKIDTVLVPFKAGAAGRRAGLWPGFAVLRHFSRVNADSARQRVCQRPPLPAVHFQYCRTACYNASHALLDDARRDRGRADRRVRRAAPGEESVRRVV